MINKAAQLATAAIHTTIYFGAEAKINLSNYNSSKNLSSSTKIVDLTRYFDQSTGSIDSRLCDRYIIFSIFNDEAISILLKYSGFICFKPTNLQWVNFQKHRC